MDIAKSIIELYITIFGKDYWLGGFALFGEFLDVIVEFNFCDSVDEFIPTEDTSN